MLARMAPLVDAWYFTDLPTPRAATRRRARRRTARAVAGEAPGPVTVARHAEPAEALAAAVAAADPADRIVVFGSFYTVGGVLEGRLPRLSAPARRLTSLTRVRMPPGGRHRTSQFGSNAHASMFKQQAATPPPADASTPADAVQQARTRARQRLIGAVVLVVIGVIGFPLLFETQPRPMPVDIPIEIPRQRQRAAARDAAGAAPRPRRAGAAAAAVDDGADARRVARPTPAAKPRRSRAAMRDAASRRRRAGRTALAKPSAPAPAPDARAVAAAASRRRRPGRRDTGDADGARAQALLEGKPAGRRRRSEARFVVQVGAFADADAARETRAEGRKLGLKTYTQVAQTPAGNRIRVRVGPFASRAEADEALAKIKAAGLAAVVLTL